MPNDQAMRPGWSVRDSWHARGLADLFDGLPFGRLGEVEAGAGSGPPRLSVRGLDSTVVIDAAVADLKAAWQAPLRW